MLASESTNTSLPTQHSASRVSAANSKDGKSSEASSSCDSQPGDFIAESRYYRSTATSPPSPPEASPSDTTPSSSLSQQRKRKTDFGSPPASVNSSHATGSKSTRPRLYIEGTTARASADTAHRVTRHTEMTYVLHAKQTRPKSRSPPPYCHWKPIPQYYPPTAQRTKASSSGSAFDRVHPPTSPRTYGKEGK